MKIILRTLSIITIILSLNGCIVFQKASYSIKPNEIDGGSAVVIFHDIKSDAIGNNEFEEDKKSLFEFMLESEEFLSMMKDEGKKIKTRDLYVEKNKLNGKVTFSFDSINNVEGIQFQDGYYFLTIPLSDSILSTNGIIVPSKEHKRIIWDKGIKELKFEMMSDVPYIGLRELVQFVKK